MAAIEFKLEIKPTTVDIEKICSFEEISSRTNQRLQGIIQCGENIQRLRYQSKIGMDNLKQVLNACYKSQLMNNSEINCHEIQLKEHRNSLDQITEKKYLAYQELTKTVIEFLSELGLEVCFNDK